MASAALTESWSELALRVLGEGGRRPGGARRAVVGLLARQDCCLSAQEIAERLREEGDRVGTASVYRALDLLHSASWCSGSSWATAARYEALIPGGDHHHHVVCDRCGRITPFEDRALERAIDRLGARLHHRVSGHEIVLRGECPRCATAS